MLYGVETKHINQALKNNPEKFPAGYVFELDKFETKQLIERRDNFAVKIFDRKIEQNESTERISSKSRYSPKAFTEKGLLQKTGEILADIVGRNLSTSNTETEIEINRDKE